MKESYKNVPDDWMYHRHVLYLASELSALFATVFMTATQYGLILTDGQKLRTVDTV